MLSRTFVRGLRCTDVLPPRRRSLRHVDLASARRSAAAAAAPPVRAPTGSTSSTSAAPMLAALGRETDAIALAYPAGRRASTISGAASRSRSTRCGPDRRSPLDSHVGMMLFKNGMPVGYGGGWPFLGTCRIGVNVFAPFRGGESALLFGEVLRVYRQRFAVGRFVVEPSQFGGTNKEGLQSGAFWFYYRLGLPPDRAATSARRAARRVVAPAADPGYRTPIPAAAPLHGLRHRAAPRRRARLRTARPERRGDPWIGERLGGDRTAAERGAERRRPRAGSDRTRPLAGGAASRLPRHSSLLVAQIARPRRLAGADERALIALMRAKGGDEFRFHDLAVAPSTVRDALVAARRARRAASPPLPASAESAESRRIAPRRPTRATPPARWQTACTPPNEAVPRPQLGDPRSRRVRGADDPQGHRHPRVSRRAHDLGDRQRAPRQRSGQSAPHVHLRDERRHASSMAAVAATPRAGSTTRARRTASRSRTTTGASSSRRAARYPPATS